VIVYLVTALTARSWCAGDMPGAFRLLHMYITSYCAREAVQQVFCIVTATSRCMTHLEPRELLSAA
jgi:hypothetical protein